MTEVKKAAFMQHGNQHEAHGCTALEPLLTHVNNDEAHCNSCLHQERVNDAAVPQISCAVTVAQSIGAVSSYFSIAFSGEPAVIHRESL